MQPHRPTPPRHVWTLSLTRVARGLAAAMLALGFVPSAQADVVVTKDGRRLEGTIVTDTKKEVVIETASGRVTVPRAEVRELERSKTPAQEFPERFAAARESIEQLLALATWASDAQLAVEARKCYRRILDLDDQNEVANKALGNVQYKGQWMTPKQRDNRQAKDEAADRKARGLVEYKGQWVTPEDKARLEQGLVLVDGEWLTLAQAKAREGLGPFAGGWVPLPLAEAAARAQRVAVAAGVHDAAAALSGDSVVLGPWPEPFLRDIAGGLDRARALFDAQFVGAPKGLALFGGRPGELYAWNRDSEPYLATIAPLSELTKTVGEPWREAVKATHGWVFWDPFPVSSVRAVTRPEFHVAGHTYYHYGHVLLNRYRYDGRLLPPWFGEGYASLVEWWVHGQNTVVLKADAQSTSAGSAAVGKAQPFSRATLTRGAWQLDLRQALEATDVRLAPFDVLARKAPGELTAVDVAMSMGVVLWIERSGAGALERFHASLKESAPPAPHQVLERAPERQKRYDTAFQAAVGLDSRAADRAWRAWFLERTPEPGAGR